MGPSTQDEKHVVEEQHYLEAALADVRVGNGHFAGTIGSKASAFLTLVGGTAVKLPPQLVPESGLGWHLFLRGEKPEHLRPMYTGGKKHPHILLAFLADAGEISEDELRDHLQSIDNADAYNGPDLPYGIVCAVRRPTGLELNQVYEGLTPFAMPKLRRGVAGPHALKVYAMTRPDAAAEINRFAIQRIKSGLEERQHAALLNKTAPWAYLWPEESGPLLKYVHRKSAPVLYLCSANAKTEDAVAALNAIIDVGAKDVFQKRRHAHNEHVYDYLHAPSAKAWKLFLDKYRKRTALDDLFYYMPSTWLATLLEDATQARRALASYTSSRLFLDALREHDLRARPKRRDINNPHELWSAFANLNNAHRKSWRSFARSIDALKGEPWMKVVNALQILRDCGTNSGVVLTGTRGLDTWIERNYEFDDRRDEYLRDVLNAMPESLWHGPVTL